MPQLPPLAPPPSDSLPPPPPPLLTLTLQASGELVDYNAGIKDSIASAVASNLGAENSRVDVEVVAASVLIIITIEATTNSTNVGATESEMPTSLSALAAPEAATRLLANVANGTITVTSAFVTDPAVGQSSSGPTRIPFTLWATLLCAATAACVCALAIATWHSQQKRPSPRLVGKGTNETTIAMEMLADKVAAERAAASTNTRSHYHTSKGNAGPMFIDQVI